MGSARAPLQCGGPGGGRSRPASPSSPGTPLEMTVPRAPPGSAFYRSLHRWRGQGGSVKIWGIRHRETRLPARGRWAAIRLFLTATRLSGLSASPLQACCLPFCSSLSREKGAERENAALGHEKGWGSNGKKYSIRFAKVMVLKGMERGWTKSIRGTTERVGVGDRMLIFSHPRDVTEKSVRRGEDTCLILFFFF